MLKINLPAQQGRIDLCQPFSSYLQQIEQASADDPQVPSLQSLGVVYGRKLKYNIFKNVIRDHSLNRPHNLFFGGFF